MTPPPPARPHPDILRTDRDYHEIRVLLLIVSVFELRPGPGHVDGLTQLAKLDFLVRHPRFAALILKETLQEDPRMHLNAPDSRAVDSPGIRHRYGPWDERYYTVVGALVGRGLVRPGVGGRSRFTLAPTPTGSRLARVAAASPPWRPVADRCAAIARAASGLSGRRLTQLILTRLPRARRDDLREPIR